MANTSLHLSDSSSYIKDFTDKICDHLIKYNAMLLQHNSILSVNICTFLTCYNSKTPVNAMLLLII